MAKATNDKGTTVRRSLPAPNGVRISGAAGVRCMRGLGRGRTGKRRIRVCCLGAARADGCATVPLRLRLFSAKPWAERGRGALLRR